MEIHSFNKSLLSTYNCAGHCGTTVSKVDYFFCKEHKIWCRASKQICRNKGDPDLFLPHSKWAGPTERAGKNSIQLPLTVRSPIWCSTEQGSH